MPCPTCGSEETIPLTLTTFDDLANAARCCEECQTVYLVVNEAFLPKTLRERQIVGWKAVRTVLDDALGTITDHPVTRRLFADPYTETDVWHRDALATLERAVATLAPVLKGADES